MTREKKEALAMPIWAFSFCLCIWALVRAIWKFSENAFSTSATSVVSIAIASMGFGVPLFFLLLFLLRRYAKGRLARVEREYPWQKELGTQYHPLLVGLTKAKSPQCVKMFLLSASVFAITWLW